MKIRGIAILGLLFLLTACALATNGLFPTFVGARAGGRGGADFGVAGDPSAINTNPAGIAFIPGKMVDFTLGAFYPNIQMNNAMNRAGTETEFSPFGSFGIVWDAPGQTLEVFADPWAYTFGGEPDSSYFPSEGEAFFAWDTAEISQNLTLKTKGQGSISNIRVYGDVVSPQPVLWQIDQLPPLPAGGRVRGIRVHFQWRGDSGDVALEAEDVRERVTLVGPAGKWNEGYLALAWDKAVFPAYITFFALKPGLRIRNLRVAVDYRFGADSLWKEIYNENGKIVARQVKKVLLSSDASAYPVSESAPIDIALKGLTLPKGELKRVHVYYHYDLQGSALNPYLHATLRAGKRMIGARRHLPPAREDTPKGRTLSRNRADMEVAHPQRPSGFKFGFGIFPQTGGKYLMNTKTALFPEGIDNRADQAFVSIAPAIAYRFNDSFSIGLALNAYFYVFELDGLTSQSSLILRGSPAGLPGGALTFGEALTNVLGIDSIRGESDSERMFGYGFGGRVGFMWKISDRLTFGASYAPKTWMQDTKGKVLVDFTRHFDSTPIFGLLAGLLLPNQGRYGFSSHYDMRIAFDLPQRVGAGLSYLAWDNFMIAVDFQWINYSDTMDKIQLTFENGDSLDMNALATTRVRGEVYSNWRDQYVVSAGFVWQLAERWVVRAGYNYGNNPIRKEHLDPQFPGIIEHHVMAGASYQVNANLQLNTAMEWGLPAKLKSGDVNYVHPDLVNTEIKMYTLAVVSGLTWNF